jgi:hypothetical protein
MSESTCLFRTSRHHFCSGLSSRSRGARSTSIGGVGVALGYRFCISVNCPPWPRMERKTRGRNETERVVVENPSDNIAFMVRLRLTVGPASQDVTAISWEDNYFSLLRGEKREVSANYEAAALAGRNPKVEVSGWNITARSAP